MIPDSPRLPEKPGSAVGFIIDAMRRYGPDLTIVATGAMTTMATVFRDAPDLKDSGANVTLMGGALTLPGNVSPVAEANISQDPEAADYLFRCGARTTMIGLDATHQTSLTRSQAHEWKALGTRAGDFPVTMTDYYIDFYLSHQPEIHGCGLHDPLAVAAALDPSLVTTFRFDLQVDLEGRAPRPHDRRPVPVAGTGQAYASLARRGRAPGHRPVHGPRHQRRSGGTRLKTGEVV